MTIKNRKIHLWGVWLLFLSSQIFGCVAAVVPAAVAVSAGVGAGAGIILAINLASDQYPSIDFNEAAPVEAVYQNNFNEVWEMIIKTLNSDLGEKLKVAERMDGVITTAKKSLNERNWFESAIGKATFKYEYDINVKTVRNGTKVKAYVPFWEEKVFGNVKEKNIPEGSNMMRHILFSKISEKLKTVYVLKPPSHDSDVRTAQLEMVEWKYFRNVYEHDKQTAPIEESSLTEANQADPLILQVQEKLIFLGYNPGAIDGLMGPKTSKALRKYQKDKNIATTGHADENTLIALGVKKGAVQHLAPKPTLPSKADDVPPAGDIVYVSSPTELKKERNMFSDTLVTIPQGGAVSIAAVEGDWCRVRYKELTGFIHSSFFPDKQVAKPKPVAVKKGTKEKIPPKNDKTISAGATEKSKQEIPASGEPVNTVIGQGEVTETTFLLSEPSFMADRIQGMKAGQQVDLLEERVDFYKVRTNGKEGYIYTDFINIK